MRAPNEQFRSLAGPAEHSIESEAGAIEVDQKFDFPLQIQNNGGIGQHKQALHQSRNILRSRRREIHMRAKTEVPAQTILPGAPDRFMKGRIHDGMLKPDKSLSGRRRACFRQVAHCTRTGSATSTNKSRKPGKGPSGRP